MADGRVPDVELFIDERWSLPRPRRDSAEQALRLSIWRGGALRPLTAAK
jgi:hypothetical protein